MPKRDEKAHKRTYRFAESLLAQLEAEAAKHRRAVNTQLEMILEEWFAQQKKQADESEKDERTGPLTPTPLVAVVAV